jgi:short-subunit dehydrogenase
MSKGNHKTALITGASAGIGKAFAEELAKDGFDLVLTARRRDRLDALADSLRREHGVRVEVIAEDLTDPQAPERIFAAVKARGLHVDVLVNNAGWGVADTFAQVPWKTHAEFLQVLVTAVPHLTHLCLPGMLERGQGHILNVASLAGLLPGAPTSTMYAAAKSFLIKFSESLSAEVSRKGVHVCAVCPGFTYSEFHDVMGTRSVVSKLASFRWQTANDVAREGLDAAMGGEVVHVTGLANRALSVLMQHLPGDLARSIVAQQAKSFRRTEQG